MKGVVKRASELVKNLPADISEDGLSSEFNDRFVELFSILENAENCKVVIPRVNFNSPIREDGREKIFRNMRFKVFISCTLPRISTKEPSCGAIPPDPDYIPLPGTVVAVRNKMNTYNLAVFSSLKNGNLAVYQFNSTKSETQVSPKDVAYFPLTLPETFTEDYEYPIGSTVVFVRESSTVDSQPEIGTVTKRPHETPNETYELTSNGETISVLPSHVTSCK